MQEDRSSDDNNTTPPADQEAVTPSPTPAPSEVTVDGRLIAIRGRTLRDLREQPGMLNAPEMVVPGLAAVGRVTLYYAQEKLGKSTYGAFTAAQVSCGGMVCGEPVVQGVVLWVGLEEDQSDAVRRFEAMHGDRDRLVLLDRLTGTGGAFAQLKAEVLAHRPRLVIIDSLARYGLDSVDDENGSTGWNRELDKIAALARECRCAIVILHHANRSNGTYRGTSAIGAAVDMIVQMAVAQNDACVRTFHAIGRWPISSYALRYDSTNATFALADAPGDAGTGGGGDAKVESLKGEVLDWLAQNPGSGKKRIREAIGGRAANVDAAIEVLLSEGRIVYGGRTEGYALADTPPEKPAEGDEQLSL